MISPRTAERLPDFLGLDAKGKLVLRKPHDKEAIVRAISTLPAKEQLAFGEALLGQLGHDDDYYEGWALTPHVVMDVLTAPWQKLVLAYLNSLGYGHSTLCSDEMVNQLFPPQ